MNERIMATFQQMVDAINEATEQPMVDPNTRQKVGKSEIPEVILEQIGNFTWTGSRTARGRRGGLPAYWPRIQDLLNASTFIFGKTI